MVLYINNYLCIQTLRIRMIHRVQPIQLHYLLSQHQRNYSYIHKCYTCVAHLIQL